MRGSISFLTFLTFAAAAMTTPAVAAERGVILGGKKALAIQMLQEWASETDGIISGACLSARSTPERTVVNYLILPRAQTRGYFIEVFEYVDSDEEGVSNLGYVTVQNGENYVWEHHGGQGTQDEYRVAVEWIISHPVYFDLSIEGALSRRPTGPCPDLY